MGWFNKNEQKQIKGSSPGLPELPKLPKLPELPPTQNTPPKEPIHQLPSFPNNSIGQKFSQDTIKQAVTGKKEGEEVLEADDFAQQDTMQMMPLKPLKQGMAQEIPPPLTTRISGVTQELSPLSEPKGIFKTSTKEAEPRFIRIDKFQESLQTFEKAKEKITAIQNLLRDIKTIKQHEEQQLSSWENEMQIIKQQIEKIDGTLFSKLE